VDLEIIYPLKRSSKVCFLILALPTVYLDPKRRMKEGHYFCKYVFKIALSIHKKIPSSRALWGMESTFYCYYYAVRMSLS